MALGTEKVILRYGVRRSISGSIFIQDARWLRALHPKGDQHGDVFEI